MKRIIKLLLLLLALLLPATATAYANYDYYPLVMIDYDFKVDGICYLDHGSTAEVSFTSMSYTAGDYGERLGIGSSSNYSGNVTIPETVTYNGKTYSVTSISEYAFAGCRNLTSVIIPNSVTSIGERAFNDCSGLTSVNIPITVSSIGNNAFSGCSGINQIIVESGNPIYDSRENCNSIIKTQTNTLITGCKNTVIPTTVTSIGSEAFSGRSGLTNVNIPNSVITIGNSAFSGCTGLTSVTIPNSVTSIGSQVFSGCSNMTNVVIGKSTETIGDGAFLRCPRIAKVTSLNNVPPSCDANLFNDKVYIHAVLYVPDVSVSEYIMTDGWGPFIHVEGIETSDIVLANSVTLDRQNMIIGVGTTSRLIATVLPDSTTNKAITWASSNPAVATVDDNGLVTAIAPGSAIITVMTTDGSNLCASCTVETFNDMSQYGNYLSMSDTAVFHGETIVIPVKMTNSESIISFQTDIFLQEGLELLKEDGEYIIDPSERMTRTHSIMSNQLPDGSIRVLCYSSNYKPFTGNSDDLFYLTVKVADNAEGGYTIQLKNTLLTNSDFVDLAAPDLAATVNVKAYLLGDANNSGLVTVGDVVTTAQYVLLLNPLPFNFEAADVNFDGNITVGDVSRIAWMVLNPTAYAPMRAPALWCNGDRMSGEGVTLMAGETRTVSILLDNETEYTAFQMDLTLPEGLTASNFQLTSRAGSHAFDVNAIDGDKLRALCYSPAIEVIDGHSGALLTFDVTATDIVEGSIMVDGIEMVTADCQTVLMNGFAIGVNGNSSVNEVVGAKEVARVDYFNVAGKKIDRPESGVNLIVTTYTDGTRSTEKKLIK